MTGSKIPLIAMAFDLIARSYSRGDQVEIRQSVEPDIPDRIETYVMPRIVTSRCPKCQATNGMHKPWCKK